MKKLISQRPVLYMGRSYERGAELPAHDSEMVAAWLRAGSAVWSGGALPPTAPPGLGGPEGKEKRRRGGKA